jgi:hypothetical protein
VAVGSIYLRRRIQVCYEARSVGRIIVSRKLFLWATEIKATGTRLVFNIGMVSTDVTLESSLSHAVALESVSQTVFLCVSYVYTTNRLVLLKVINSLVLYRRGVYCEVRTSFRKPVSARTPYFRVKKCVNAKEISSAFYTQPWFQNICF